jgi:SAM-dependent methyltransferase
MDPERPNATASNASFEFQALQHAHRYRAALMEEFTPFLQGRIIEIGAGVGQMTELLAQVQGVLDILSVEPDERLCAAFKARLPHQPLVHGTIETAPRDRPWSVILSINVLEHIREDERELRLYSDILSPQQGHLCLFVPAGPAIYAPLDRDFGHFRRYTKQALRAGLERAGFQIVRLNYFNWVGFFAWWLNFCVLRKRRFDPGAVRFFDRFILPPTHWLERHISAPPFGQSLLAVARAPLSRA